MLSILPPHFVFVSIQPVFENFKGSFQNIGFYLLHKRGHKCKVYFTLFIDREQNFLSLNTFIINLSIEAILFR